MKTYIQKTSSWLSKNKMWLIPVVIVVLVIVTSQYFLGTKKPVYETMKVEPKNLQEIVSVTGHVKASDSVNLSFERTGKVASIGVKVGDKISAGERILSLISGDLSAQISQSQALIKGAQAQLAQLLAGSRGEEVSLQEATVAKAKSSLGEAANSLEQTVNDVYTKVDDAIRGKLDVMFTNPKSSNPKLSFSTDFVLQINIENERLALEAKIIEANSRLLTISNDSILKSGLSQISIFPDLLSLAKKFSDDVAVAVNSLASNSSLSQTTIDGWKANVTSARSGLSLAISSLQTVTSNFQTASDGLIVETNRLALTKAGPTSEQIAAQQAVVAQAQASEQNLEAQLVKYTLRSPIDGVVTKQDAELGETLNAGQIIASVMSVGRYEMEAFVPEADIAKVKVGNKANVTLDAYGSDVYFPAEVYQIDPAETVIEGVATYRVRLRFIQEDNRIKSGMTANIDLITKEVSQVIAIPIRVVASLSGEKSVKVLIGSKPVERKVVLGVKGSDGMVEVLSGLVVGENVITAEK
ncbi:MAG: efflux RND transporter periplasmic adaptor subunit [bacterium]